MWIISICDAWRQEAYCAVFIIREDLEEEFCCNRGEDRGKDYGGRICIPVRWKIFRLDLRNWHRTKPWGTGQG